LSLGINRELVEQRDCSTGGRSDKIWKQKEVNMSYQYNREDKETAIEQLAELYPKAFSIDPDQRRPLKRNIVNDLEKAGAPLAPTLMRTAVDFYQSHFSYQYKLQTGARRVDLHGKECVPVTQSEQAAAFSISRNASEKCEIKKKGNG
jgi:sRNA-binding protein